MILILLEEKKKTAISQIECFFFLILILKWALSIYNNISSEAGLKSIEPIKLDSRQEIKIIIIIQIIGQILKRKMNLHNSFFLLIREKMIKGRKKNRRKG